MSAHVEPMDQAARIERAACLNTATSAGDLAAAYRELQALRSLPIAAAAAVLLEAGFSVGCTRRVREFWTSAQGDVAKAARAKVEGWGVRGLEAAR